MRQSPTAQSAPTLPSDSMISAAQPVLFLENLPSTVPTRSIERAHRLRLAARWQMFRVLTFAIIGSCAGPILGGQTVLPSPTANRVIEPIDETAVVPLKGTVHPLAQARFDRGPAPISTPTGRLKVLLKRSSAQQQALTQYLANVHNPSSPIFHRWLTPQQYGAQFGISDSDLQTVESWLRSHGFKIEQVPKARNLILFSGNFDQLQNAFHIALHAFSVNGEIHFANVSDPQIPLALVPVIAAVGPLNNFRPHPPLTRGPRGHYSVANKRLEPDYSGGGFFGGLLYVTPSDAATIYDTPNTTLNAKFASGTSYDGAGINIGIMGVSNIPLQDVENYRTAFLGETTANVNLPTIVIADNDPGQTGDGWEDEALLDNEIAGGLAPKAKIYFYTAASTDLSWGGDFAILRALDDNQISILSESVADCEAGDTAPTNSWLLEANQQAAAQGITVVVAAGDSGSAGCDDFDTQTQATLGFAVNGFASTPYDIAVGGTDFDVLTSQYATYVSGSNNPPYYRTALEYIPESTWNDSTISNTTYANNSSQFINANIIAGSGGSSNVYPKPAFQISLTPNDGQRDLPDVSLLAGNGFYDAIWMACTDSFADGKGAQTYTDCQNTNGTLNAGATVGGFGGTSASAPAFAGTLALVSQSLGGARLGQADYVLYQLAQTMKYSTVFHDVVTGNNAVACSSGSPGCGSNGFMTGYNAGTNYDLATGLGSVDVTQLIDAWQSVSLAPTSTTLEINGSKSSVNAVHGTDLTFNVGVTPTTAAGVVEITDTADETTGGTANGPQYNGQFNIQLSSGAGTANYNGLPGGTYTVSANYGGDTADAASASSPINVTITPEASETSLSISASNQNSGDAIANVNNIPYGSNVYLNASILGASGAYDGVATGTVTYLNGSATLGTAPVANSGQNLASFPPETTPFQLFSVGTYNVTAKYSGDAGYNPSASPSKAFSVVQSPTTTIASASPTSISSSTDSTITVTVTTALNSGAQPTGTVALTEAGNTLSQISSFTVSAQTSASSPTLTLTGSASISGSQLSAGVNAITATYSGDSNYASSSATANVTLPGGSPAIGLTNSGSVAVTAGGSGTSTLTVTPSGGFTGAINFACLVNGAPSGLTCSAPMTDVTGTSSVNSTLTITTASATAVGNYYATITASDAATGKISASTQVAVTINAETTPAISLSNGGSIAVTAGGSGISTLTVTPSGGFTGAINFGCLVSGAPTGLTCSAPSTSVTGTSAVNSTLTIATTSSTAAGKYYATITGSDAVTGKISASTQVAVTVSAETVATTPTFNVPGGTYSSVQTVYIGDTTPGATVYYTTDGTKVTSNSTVYTGGITVSSTETIEAMAVANGYANSAIASATYTINLAPAATPTFSPAPGTYTSAQTIYMGETTPGATVYYTTNGTTPTTSSTVYIYGTGITVSSTETIEAMAVANGYANSAIASATYTIDLPSFTLNASPSSLTLDAGNQGNVTLTVTPQNSFNSAVSFACSGLPNGVTCSFNPTTVTPSGAVMTTLTITASAQAALQRVSSHSTLPIAAIASAVCLLGWKKRRGFQATLMIALAVISFGVITSCGVGHGSANGGGGGGGGSTPESATVTVIASSGSIQKTASISITVN